MHNSRCATFSVRELTTRVIYTLQAIAALQIKNRGLQNAKNCSNCFASKLGR